MKTRFYYPNKTYATSGFTLIELIIALVLTTGLLAVAGIGLIGMMQASKTSETKIAVRTNFNRAIDFVSDEIRMAKTVQSALNNISVPTPLCGTPTGVLDITLTDNTHTIYYMNDISSCSGSTWVGPATLNRLASDGSTTVVIDALQAPTTALTCSSGTLVGANGFYACLSTNSRLVTLSLNGKVPQGNSPTATEDYLVTSQAFARNQ